jgi:hypothetical protein
MVHFSTHSGLSRSRTSLSRQHRAWIALYSLQNADVDRNQVLIQNNVTEKDLLDYWESWQQMRLSSPLHHG